jgi:hypothetical protein
MLKWLKLSQHKHSGRLRPHEHTSYLPLGLLLVIVGFALTAYTAYAATPYTGPESGSIGLTGTMPGKPPTTAATIDLPKDQQHFGTSPITVSGTCPTNTLVELFKSDIFAGSTICSDANTYSLEVDLLIGKNILIARVYDTLNQAGPDSNSVTVFYDALPAQAGPITSSGLNGAQLLLNTDAVFRGVFPGKEMNVPIDILGGTPPFAVNIQWGDSTNKVVPRNDNVSFTSGHTYSKPGTYQVSLQATDAAGRVAFLTFAAIVNGQPIVANTASLSNESATNQLLILWPLYTAAIAVVTSFFLGEKREKRILRTHGLLMPS